MRASTSLSFPNHNFFSPPISLINAGVSLSPNDHMSAAMGEKITHIHSLNILMRLITTRTNIGTVNAKRRKSFKNNEIEKFFQFEISGFIIS